MKNNKEKPMKETLCQGFDGELRLIKETLSDASVVYNLEVGKYEFPATNYQAAERAYGQIITAEDTAWEK